MGKLTKISPVVDMTITGKASVREGQQGSFTNDPIQYDPSKVYLVPKQFAHEIPSANPDFAPSRRVFAMEMEWKNGKLVATGNLTAIKISAINQTFYGEVDPEKDAPRIKCEERDGLYRPVRGGEPGFDAPTFVRATEGTRGFGVDAENQLFIKTPMIYIPTKQVTGYVSQLSNEGNGRYNMEVHDDETLALTTQRIWLWRTEFAAGKTDLTFKDIVEGQLDADKIEMLNID